MPVEKGDQSRHGLGLYLTPKKSILQQSLTAFFFICLDISLRTILSAIPLWVKNIGFL